MTIGLKMEQSAPVLELQLIQKVVYGEMFPKHYQMVDDIDFIACGIRVNHFIDSVQSDFNPRRNTLDHHGIADLYVKLCSI